MSCALVIGLRFLHACAFVLCTVLSASAQHDASDISPLSSEATPRWNATTGSHAQLIVTAHSECVNAVDFSPNGTQIATCSNDGTVRIWDATTGKYVHGWSTTGSVLALAFTPDGGRLIVGTIDHGIHAITTSNWQSTIVAKSTDVPQAIAITLDGKTVAIGSSPIEIFDGDTFTSLGLLERHENGGDSLSFSHDGQTLASGNADQLGIVWDMAKRKPRFERLRDYWVTSVNISPDDRLVAMASFSRDANSQTVEIELVDPDNGRLCRRLIGDKLAGHIHSDVSLLFSPDNRFLISCLRGSHDTGKVEGDMILTQPEENVTIWSTETNQILAKRSTRGPYRIAIDATSTRFAFANVDGKLEVWKIDSFITANDVGSK